MHLYTKASPKHRKLGESLEIISLFHLVTHTFWAKIVNHSWKNLIILKILSGDDLLFIRKAKLEDFEKIVAKKKRST